MENLVKSFRQKAALTVAVAATLGLIGCQYQQDVIDPAELDVRIRSKSSGDISLYISKIGDISMRNSTMKAEQSIGVSSITMLKAQQEASLNDRDAAEHRRERKSGMMARAKKESLSSGLSATPAERMSDTSAKSLSEPSVEVSSEGRTAESVAKSSGLAAGDLYEADSSVALATGSVAGKSYTDEEVLIAEVDRPVIDDMHKYRQHHSRAGILTAGDIDDNLNITHFTQYLTRMMSKSDLRSRYQDNYPFVDYSGLAQFYIKDKRGKAVSHTRIELLGGNNKVLYSSYTGFDGLFTFLPQEINQQSRNSAGSIMQQASSVRIYLDSGAIKTFKLPQGISKGLFSGQQGTHNIPVFDIQLKNHMQGDVAKLDLMFVVDTTGSMSDELRYLQAELDSIIASLKQQHRSLDIRIGLVFYRDNGDNYVVRNYRFDRDMQLVRQVLSGQSANGGGDYPEAMELALASAVHQQWREESDVARMMFLLADAPPHMHKMQAALQQMFNMRDMGIHFYPVAASGAAEESEYLMRLGAQLTHGRYLFLTDDSGVGNSHAEPKVACYQVTQLNSLIERVIASEISGERIEAEKHEVLRETGKYQQGLCL